MAFEEGLCNVMMRIDLTSPDLFKCCIDVDEFDCRLGLQSIDLAASPYNFTRHNNFR